MGGGKRMFGEISNFLERSKGESGGLVFFSPFIKKGNIGLWIFFMKEDHLNYSGRATRVVEPLKHSVVKRILVFKW